jgi:pyroglutamyl-peptidase
MKILISGFKPFLGQPTNPSQKLALDLQDQFAEVVSIILPVEYKQSFLILEREIHNVEPDFVIMIGQAADRKNVCFEKIGLNWIQSKHPDESGLTPSPQMIEKSEPLALMSMFPIDQHCENLKSKNLPVEISFSAGAYVCNDLYFRILNEFKSVKSVFVHVPLASVLSYESQLEILTQLVHSVRGN